MRTNQLSRIIFIFFIWNSFVLNGQIRSDYNPLNVDQTIIKDSGNLLHDYSTSIQIGANMRLDLFSSKMFRVRQSTLKGDKFPFCYQIPFAIGKYKLWEKVNYRLTEDETTIYVATSDLRIHFIKNSNIWMVWDALGKKLIYPSEGEVYGMFKSGYSFFDAASYFNEENDNSRYSHFFYNPDTHRYDIYLKDDLILDQYFIYGPDYKEIFRQHNELVGPEPLLPRKAYGSFQTQHIGCVGSQEKLMEVARLYNQLKIPLDNIIIDYEWGDGCDGEKDIKWGSRLDWSSSYTSPLTVEKFIDSLKRTGINVMLIHHNVPEFPGRITKGWTMFSFPWKDWWSVVYKTINQGVAGIWQDTRINDITDHYIYLGLQEYKNERPYFLGNYELFENSDWAMQKMYKPMFNVIGMRRSPFHWTGDEDHTWAEYMFKIDAVTNKYGSMKGLSYVTTDCETYDWILQVRRNQFNEFTPISRTHNQKPWRSDGKFNPSLYAFDENDTNSSIQRPIEEKLSSENRKTLIDNIRKYRSLRYQLIPYLYNSAYENYSTGMPICRPMMLAFPDDPNCNKNQYSYQYMFGPDILVAPVYERRSNKVSIYLPRGNGWVDFWNKSLYEGGKSVNYDIRDIGKLPLFIRSGAILPMQTKRLRITPEPQDTVIFEIYPDKYSSCTLYDDDGKSLDYQKGKLGITKVSYDLRQDNSEINISRINGSFDKIPGERTYMLNVNLQNHNPGLLTIDGKKVQQDIKQEKNAPAFWFYNKEDKRLTIVKKQNTSKALQIGIYK